MRSILTLFIAMLSFMTTEAQQITEKYIDFTGKESLSFDIEIADSIIISTWERDDIYLKSSVDINMNRDNEAYIISFEENASDVKVMGRFSDNYFKPTGNCNCCVKANIYWQVLIPEGTTFTVETINGNIMISGNTDAMRVKTISGFIDLSLPGEWDADLDFSTISGMIYTNHNINSYGEHSGVPMVIREKLNRGGNLIRLETISGDIFFREEG